MDQLIGKHWHHMPADEVLDILESDSEKAVSYTHLRAHETVLDLVCRLLLEKKKQNKYTINDFFNIKSY